MTIEIVHIKIKYPFNMLNNFTICTVQFVSLLSPQPPPLSKFSSATKTEEEI